MSNTTYYSLSLLVAGLGAVFLGAAGLQFVFFLLIFAYAMLYRISAAHFIKTSVVVFLFVPILLLLARNESFNGDVTVAHQFTLWSLYLFGIGLLLAILRLLQKPEKRHQISTATRSHVKKVFQNYSRTKTHKAMVNNTQTELSHLTAQRIKDTMTLGQIARVNQEMQARHPELLMQANSTQPEKPTAPKMPQESIDILDEIYSGEPSQSFKNPLVEVRTSLSRRLKQQPNMPNILVPVNVLSNRLQASEAGHIVFDPINSPIAQSIASQITTSTTIADIEKLSNDTKRPNVVWAKSSPTERS